MWDEGRETSKGHGAQSLEQGLKVGSVAPCERWSFSWRMRLLTNRENKIAAMEGALPDAMSAHQEMRPLMNPSAWGDKFLGTCWLGVACCKLVR